MRRLSEDSASRKTWKDFALGLTNYHVWGVLGWQDIRQRYRRSVLGPFWLTISTGLMVAALGVLYSKIFRVAIAEYLPFMGIGLIVWAYISTALNEGCNVFVASDQIIKQIRLPLTIHVSRLVWRNFLIFCHNGVVILILVAAFGKPTAMGLLVAGAGIVLTTINCFWMSMFVGILCTRYRDVTPIIANMVQIAFFLTPILWHHDLLGERAPLAYANPFFNMIEVVRRPLLSAEIPYTSLAYCAMLAVVGGIALFVIHRRALTRIPYWL